MKHLIRTVPLHFFQDTSDAYGLAFPNSIERGFDAFNDGFGIFHDVFEHWFEGKHKYFLGNASFNIGGEMAAMAAAFYYHNALGLSERHPGGKAHFGEVMRKETEWMVLDHVSYDVNRGFGEQLVCDVPYQCPVADDELEYEIKKLYDNIKTAPIHVGTPEEQQRCKEYQSSVTFQKVANLHRYGYRMAKRCVEDSKDNYCTLRDFIETWDRFFKLNDARKIASVHRGVTIRLYKENGRISWTARFERLPEFTKEDRSYLRIPLLTNESEIKNYYDL